jgi:hypothetical protein
LTYTTSSHPEEDPTRPEHDKRENLIETQPSNEVIRAAHVYNETMDVVRLWGDTDIEPNPVFSSFYRAVASLPTDHQYKSLVQQAIETRTRRSVTSGENLANVMHRALNYLAHFGGETMRNHLGSIGRLEDDQEWLRIIEGICEDDEARETYLEVITERNAMANKKNRSRPIARYIEQLGRNVDNSNANLAVISIGPSLAQGEIALLQSQPEVPDEGFSDSESTEYIVDHETLQPFKTSDHIQAVYPVDIAQDPLEDEETLKWIYACSFHPGKESKNARTYQEWKKDLSRRITSANGRFKKDYYGTDAIEAMRRIPEETGMVGMIDSETGQRLPGTCKPIIIASTVLYQLDSNTRAAWQKAAEGMIKESGGEGVIIVNDFFIGELTPDEVDFASLPYTPKWRKSEENPYPYRTLAYEYEDGVLKRVKLVDEWVDGRCTEHNPNTRDTIVLTND